MHSCDFVLWDETSPDLDMLDEIYELQIGKVTRGYNCTWYILGSSWDYLPKHVVPNPLKILHAWNLAFIYVILAHMIVGNTSTNAYPSIHVDCHLVGYKPHENIRWWPIFGLHEHFSVDVPRDHIVVATSFLQPLWHQLKVLLEERILRE